MHPADRRSSNPRQQWIPRGAAAPGLLGHDPAHQRRYAAPRRAGPSPPAPAPENESVPHLVAEIQDKLSRGAVECMICYDMVRRSAPIWSCSSCYSIFHLPCVRKWARSPTSAADSSSTSDAWRCPGCQSVQFTPASNLNYTCFCGARRDPPNDLYLTPHSCGEPCRHPLDRESDNPDIDPFLHCPHHCVLPCHPGPCPPCKAFAPSRLCPCGKKNIVRRCSDRTSPLTCGEKCDRLLNCRRHRCDRLCHTGDCSPCSAIITAPCFCAKKTEVLLCGDLAVKGDIDGVDGVFSCREPCGQKLACGNHVCPENCHPGPCGECELLPEKIRSCRCGKMKLVTERKSCLDPIPTCSGVCGKKLLCGIHQCPDKCHEGDCAPCVMKVKQKCRCGSSQQTVECYRDLDVSESFVCDKSCGRKKNCGRHRCSERCCPLARSNAQLSDHEEWDPHLCSMLCGKRLRCGQHSCQLLCHSGHCPPCMETIFSDLTCACGETFIPPPLPCGTLPPTCTRPCQVPQPCGHTSSHTCHFGDCPPCSVPVVKECVGGHLMLRNILCGSKDIRCNQLCGKTRQCGMHACTRTCHLPPCDTPSGSSSVPAGGVKCSCGQVCGAPRRDCKHTCQALCHPLTPCPDLRCDFPVVITCSCGRITASVPCSVGGNGSGQNTVFEASVIQKLPVPLQPVEANGKKIPLGQRKLSCNEECAKLEKKRVLADAFDVSTPNMDALHLGDNSVASDLLADYIRREPKWVVAVEERFKFLVMGKTKGGWGGNLRVHVFCPATKEKRDVMKLIAERWKLSVQAAGWEPKRFLVVHVIPKSKPPARILGPKSGPVSSFSPPPPFDSTVDMDPRLVVAMFDLPRDADISALVLRFGGECELVWLNDKNALAIFSDPARAATALRRLDHGSPYQGAAVVLQNAGTSVNPWGLGAKEGSLGAKGTNPWKKPLALESDDWGGGDWSSTVGDAPVPVWTVNEAAPLSATNHWHVLDQDIAKNLVASESKEDHVSAPRIEGSSAVESGVGGFSSAGQDVGTGKEPMHEEVDNWEEACD